MKKKFAAYAAGAALLLVTAGVDSAYAIPSFARQTGLSCSACHTVFPELTQVGRDFKLNGYTMTDGKKHMVPLAAMVQLDMTNYTNKSDPGNKVVNFAQGSVFYGGKIMNHLGAFAQFTYDNGGGPNGGPAFGTDLMDVRYANSANFNGSRLVYGVTVDNTPGVEDLWNTTGAWMEPFAGGTGVLQTQLNAPVNLMGGVGAYALWNNLIYVDFTAYKGANGQGLMKVFNWNTASNPPVNPETTGTSPYARIAIRHTVGNNYFMLGGFVYNTQTNDTSVGGAGTTNYKDNAVDGEWQYTNGVHNITATASHVWEKQTGTAAEVRLRDTNAKIGYTYNHKYGVSFDYQKSENTTDHSTDMTGSTVEFDYLPTEKIRLSLQINSYTKNATITGPASQDNNYYLNAWFMF